MYMFGVCTGYRVYSVLKGEVKFVRGVVSRMEYRTNKINPLGRYMCVSMSGTLVIVSENFVTFAKIPSLCSVTIL